MTRHSDTPAEPPEDQLGDDADEDETAEEKALRRAYIDEIDGVLGRSFRTIRESKSLARWEVASRLELLGQRHPTIVGVMARIDREGYTKELRHQLGAKIKWYEAEPVPPSKTQPALMVTEFLSMCGALELDPARRLEAEGFARQSVSIEGAIAGDPRLTELGKDLLLEELRSLLAGLASAKKPLPK